MSMPERQQRDVEDDRHRTKKSSNWWSDMFHRQSQNVQKEETPISSVSSSHTGSREGTFWSSSESKDMAAEEWKKERRQRSFLGGW